MHTNRIRICLFSITKRITNYKGDRPITWVMSELSKRTAELLDASAARLFEGRDVAVAFSGGIDSGIVAALAVRHASSVRLYTAGTEGSHDIAAAREIAPQIGAELSEIAVRESDIPDILINATVDSDYTTYAGLFAELTDLVNQYAPNVKAMFEEARPHMALSKALVTIKTDMSLPVTVDDMLYTGEFKPVIKQLFDRYEFGSLKKYIRIGQQMQDSGVFSAAGGSQEPADAEKGQ